MKKYKENRLEYIKATVKHKMISVLSTVLEFVPKFSVNLCVLVSNYKSIPCSFHL